jgi:bla regulator protein blaR1
MTSWVPFDLLDHLWQSTLFTAVVWLVARTVRTNAARVRYWLWLTASVKFLVPLSLLVSFGERFAWRTAAAGAPAAVSAVIERVLTPTATTVATTTAAPIASSTTVWPVVMVLAWGAGVLFVLAQWWRQWRPIRRALRDAHPTDIGAHDGVTVRASVSMIEPGVFGIWRPVLLVPEGISERLTPAQLRALIAHERCHIRHHDNLTASLHMAVEALFWFHPLVWWLERRLIEERERACDEYVLQSGSTPRDYAEGILEVCRFAKDPSPVFVAGITGADLRRRIESILRNETARPLGRERAVALLICAAVAVVGPVTAGAVQSTKPAQAAADNRPRFEVASIKRTPEVTGPGADFSSMPGGRFHARNNEVANLIGNAYGRVPRYLIANMPDWVTADRYDLEAKAADPAATSPQMMLMLQTLLEERFKLRWHRETREGPVYVLSVARSGHKLRPSKDCVVERDPAKPLPAPPPAGPSHCAATTGCTEMGRAWCGPPSASTRTRWQTRSESSPGVRS